MSDVDEAKAPPTDGRTDVVPRIVGAELESYERFKAATARLRAAEAQLAAARAEVETTLRELAEYSK